MQQPIGPLYAFERLVEDAGDHGVGMEHQVLADQPAAVGQAVGKVRRARVQQQPRRADAVAGDDHDLRLAAGAPRRPS